MAQFFIFGSSNAYGVGGAEGGWPDLLKRQMHHQMFSPSGAGDVHELYNFGKSGAKIDFVTRTWSDLYKNYRRNKGPSIALLSIGGNDCRADGGPDAFVTTPEAFQTTLASLLRDLTAAFDAVLVLGLRPFDETKTMPFRGPQDLALYFANSRRALFNDLLRFACKETGASFVETPLPDALWIETCLYKDGLHPNSTGHERITCDLMDRLSPFLKTN